MASEKTFGARKSEQPLSNSSSLGIEDESPSNGSPAEDNSFPTLGAAFRGKGTQQRGGRGASAQNKGGRGGAQNNRTQSQHNRSKSQKEPTTPSTPASSATNATAQEATTPIPTPQPAAAINESEVEDLKKRLYDLQSSYDKLVENNEQVVKKNVMLFKQLQEKEQEEAAEVQQKSSNELTLALAAADAAKAESNQLRQKWTQSQNELKIAHEHAEKAKHAEQEVSKLLEKAKKDAEISSKQHAAEKEAAAKQLSDVKAQLHRELATKGELSEKLADADTQKSKWAAEKQELNASVIDLSNKLREAKTKVKREETEQNQLEVLKQNVLQLTRQLEDEKKNSSSLSQQIVELKSEQNAANIAYTNLVDEMKKQQENNKVALDAYVRNNESLTNQIQELTSQKTQVEKNFAEYKQKSLLDIAKEFAAKTSSPIAAQKHVAKPSVPGVALATLMNIRKTASSTQQ